MTKRAWRAATVAVLLGCFASVPNVRAQGRVTAKSGDTVTLSVGARDGAKVGMRGEVLMTMQAGGREQTFAIATFEVTGVREGSSAARLLQVGENFQVMQGMTIRMSQPLVKPAAVEPPRPRATPTAVPWAPEAGRDPMFYMSHGDQELQSGQLDRAEAYYRKVLDAMPGDLLAQRGLDQVAAKRHEAAAAAQAAREEADRKRRVQEQLANADYYLKAGDKLLEEGDKAGAKAYWDKIAAVDPNYPGLPERMRKLTPSPGEKKHFSPSGGEFAFIPAGTFQMGCVSGDSRCGDSESPRHAVAVTRGFWMMSHLVTVAGYRAYSEATGHGLPGQPDWNGDDHPVVNVSWDDAVAYCSWAGGRLPTEAEWEYGARGGKDGLVYPWGNEISHEEANYGADSCCSGLAQGRDQWVNTSPVGSFEANGFGLFDMAGNVWEWCADWYGSSYYGSSPVADPKGPSSGSGRVLRGGSWGSDPWGLRTSCRVALGPTVRGSVDGFRCVRDADSP